MLLPAPAINGSSPGGRAASAAVLGGRPAGSATGDNPFGAPVAGRHAPHISADNPFGASDGGGGGAGTGLSAKCEEAGGIDLIVIYNSGRYRMAGRGSLAGLLAYGNANEIVCEMAREVLPVVQRTPVLAGVNGTDPFMIPDQFLRRLIDLGFSGVQNFPTVGLIDGTFRANLEETGMGYGLEVELIARARELDLLTTPYVFNEADAAAMAEIASISKV